MAQESPNYPVKPEETPVIDPSTIDQLVRNQTRELELKARELDLQQQQDLHNFEFSKASLNAQAQDRKDQRVFLRQQRRNAYILTGCIVLMVVGMVVAAMLWDKDQVALEIIKSVVLLLSGGAGGYAIGRNKGQSTASAAEDES